MIDSYNLYFSKQQRDTEAVISNEEIANQLKKLQRATKELEMRQGISPLTLMIDSYNLYFSKQQRDSETGISNEEIYN